MVNQELHVEKRSGKLETISFDKITNRLKFLKELKPELKNINIHIIVKDVISKIYDKIPTAILDELSAEICISKGTDNYEYMTLGSRIIISNNHKNTKECFLEKLKILKQDNNISNKLIEIAIENKDVIKGAIDYSKDYLFNYFSFKTLEKSYLLKNKDNKIIERIQDLIMRVSLGIHAEDIESVIETYQFISDKYFIHATPTLFHSGLEKPQLLSCFLGGIHDSVDGIYTGLQNCAKISKWAGGIGINIHNIRAKGSYIKGTSGQSNGIIPMLKLFNDTARFINQSGKRFGSFAIYIEPWHLEISNFIELRKNHGEENMRTRDLFLGLWIPDLFMKSVESNKDWYLFCPNDVPDLMEVYGKEFNIKYNQYVEEKRYKKKVKARQIWLEILGSQIETGLPYILYKDACNIKCNQKNLGTIKGSNLCTEIIEYHNENEYACCNLGSIGLPEFVENAKFNFIKLGQIVEVLTKNLNKIIDLNYYPIKETKKSNLSHRPIGIGIQGLADVYAILEYPFDSDEARKLNKDIFETIYYHSLKTSNELSKKLGPYSSFKGSPTSQGILQFDLWNEKPHTDRYDWNALKSSIKEYGLRNSLLLAPMPTASTSQILGNNECFEPFTSNIYVRNTLAGNFVVINKHLVKKLTELGIWSIELKQKIIKNDGSVQNIDEIPLKIKNIYKTVWEISQKVLIDLAADRGIYICQSQSLNLFIKQPSFQQLTKMHFYSWNKGLKTGIYYLRTQPKTKTQQFTVEEPECEMCSA
jgi:ribonucleoside-diphosphate reductase alpha chain